MALFDVQGPAGYALTATLYTDRSDVAVESGIELTESQSRPGRYRGTTARDGWYQAQVKSGSTVVAYWDIRLRDDVVAYGEDRAHSLWATPSPAPAVVVPEPIAGHVTAYVVCRDATGAAQSGVVVKCQLLGVVDAALAGTAWSQSPQTATSGSNGVASFVLPAEGGLKFRAWRDNGSARVFFVGSDPVLQIPDLIG
jgi:hypothetical protein